MKIRVMKDDIVFVAQNITVSSRSQRPPPQLFFPLASREVKLMRIGSFLVSTPSLLYSNINVKLIKPFKIG